MGPIMPFEELKTYHDKLSIILKTEQQEQFTSKMRPKCIRKLNEEENARKMAETI